jgi:hypothetical protein
MTTPNEPLVEALLALQTFEGLSDPANKDASYDLQLAKLRAPLPVSILQHHSHRRQRGKRSIALASRNGACGHCHLAIPRALVLQMSRSGALGTCPHCEGFLYMEVESPAEPIAGRTPPRKAKTAAKSTAGPAASRE